MASVRVKLVVHTLGIAQPRRCAQERDKRGGFVSSTSSPQMMVMQEQQPSALWRAAALLPYPAVALDESLTSSRAARRVLVRRPRPAPPITRRDNSFADGLIKIHWQRRGGPRRTAQPRCTRSTGRPSLSPPHDVGVRQRKPEVEELTRTQQCQERVT